MSSGGGGNGSYPHDVTTQSGLTKIYNARVVKAEHMCRPVIGTPNCLHEGVRWVLLYFCMHCELHRVHSLIHVVEN